MKDAIANQFCKMYVNTSHYKASKDSRAIRRKIKSNNPLDASYTPFTATQTADAIRSARNSTAAGQNGITALHLKNIGPIGIQFLTRLFNLLVQKADITAIWKAANGVPVPKPGKPADQDPAIGPSRCWRPRSK